MSRRAFVIALVAVGLTCVVQSLAHLHETLQRGTIGSIVDLDRNNGIPDLISTAAIAAGAVAAWVSVAHSRWLSLGLPGALSLVAIDDLTQERLGTSTPRGAVVLAAAAGTAVLIIVIAVTADTRVRWTLGTGLVALVASIAVGEVPDVIGWLERERGEQIAELETVVKQGLELLGWGLVALGLWDRAVGLRPPRTGRRQQLSVDTPSSAEVLEEPASLTLRQSDALRRGSPPDRTGRRPRRQQTRTGQRRSGR